MNRYFVSEIYENENFTAGVVNKHIEEWLSSWGYKRLRYPFFKKNNLLVKIIRIAQTFYWYLTISKNAIVVFHFPVFPRAFKTLLRLFSKKGIYTVALVHDIEGLRFNNNRELEEEKRLLLYFRHIIVHNQAMRAYLQDSYPESQMSLLWLFDYKSAEIDFKTRSFEPSIAIAANLEKAKYVSLLHNWINAYPELTLFIYGKIPKDLKEQTQNNQLHFKGAVAPEELPQKIEGSFGMVWDGSSLETCADNFGNYLRYNTPHKLSMYLSAGLPVIVWNESAMAEWVQENEVGIAVASWQEAAEKIKILDDTIYQNWHQNAMQIGKKLREGFFLKKVLEKIENDCGLS